MFNKKTKLKLTDFECNLLINGMNEFRNMLLADGMVPEIKKFYESDFGKEYYNKWLETHPEYA